MSTTAPTTDEAENRLRLTHECENARVTRTYYPSDGVLVAHDREEMFNYVADRWVESWTHTARFPLADDGETVEHAGLHWKEYARRDHARRDALATEGAGR